MVNPITWDHCSICHEDMDGSNGLVAISKRCYHVFHKTCIEGSLDVCDRKCPLCRRKNFSKYEFVPNPEYVEQYKKWLADKTGYTYERAFLEEYGHSHEEANLPAEHIIRPIELRGLPPRETLTPEEIHRYFREMHDVIQALSIDATREQIEKAKREASEADDLMLAFLSEQSDKQNESLAEQGERLAEQGERLASLSESFALGRMWSDYDRKVSVLDKKLNEKYNELEKMPYSTEKNTLTIEVINVSTKLTAFSREFSASSQTENRTTAEARDLLLEVDSRLEAFIDGQPEHIKEILRDPIEVQDPQNNDEPWYHNTATVIASLVACIFSVLAVRKYFWGNRNVCQNTNG